MPILIFVQGLKTFPPFSTEGIPSAPVTVNAGSQFLRKIHSIGSLQSGEVSPAQGELFPSFITQNLGNLLALFENIAGQNGMERNANDFSFL